MNPLRGEEDQRLVEAPMAFGDPIKKLVREGSVLKGVDSI